MKSPAAKQGVGQPGRCLVRVPLGVSQRFVFVLRKLQIRKALGNKRVTGEYYTPVWHGATECSLQGQPCPASQIELQPRRTASPLLPAAGRQPLLGLAVLWSFTVSQLLEVTVGQEGLGSREVHSSLRRRGKHLEM